MTIQNGQTADADDVKKVCGSVVSHFLRDNLGISTEKLIAYDDSYIDSSTNVGIVPEDFYVEIDGVKYNFFCGEIYDDYADGVVDTGKWACYNGTASEIANSHIHVDSDTNSTYCSIFTLLDLKQSSGITEIFFKVWGKTDISSAYSNHSVYINLVGSVNTVTLAEARFNDDTTHYADGTVYGVIRINNDTKVADIYYYIDTTYGRAGFYHSSSNISSLSNYRLEFATKDSSGSDYYGDLNVYKLYYTKSSSFSSSIQTSSLTTDVVNDLVLTWDTNNSGVQFQVDGGGGFESISPSNLEYISGNGDLKLKATISKTNTNELVKLTKYGLVYNLSD